MTGAHIRIAGMIGAALCMAIGACGLLLPFDVKDESYVRFAMQFWAVVGAPASLFIAAQIGDLLDAYNERNS